MSDHDAQGSSPDRPPVELDYRFNPPIPKTSNDPHGRVALIVLLALIGGLLPIVLFVVLLGTVGDGVGTP